MKPSASGVGAVSVDEPSDLRARAGGGFGSKRVLGRRWKVAEACASSVGEKGQNRGFWTRAAMVLKGKMVMLSAQGVGGYASVIS